MARLRDGAVQDKGFGAARMLMIAGSIGEPIVSYGPFVIIRGRDRAKQLAGHIAMNSVHNSSIRAKHSLNSFLEYIREPSNAALHTIILGIYHGLRCGCP